MNVDHIYVFFFQMIEFSIPGTSYILPSLDSFFVEKKRSSWISESKS